MSVWTTKASVRDREYIILQHTLKGVNYAINGVKFRDGYAVVEKNSKTHQYLKRVPVLRSAKEFDITYLTKLRFITKPMDIKIVYGKDVYQKYLEAVEAAKAKAAQQKQEEKVQKHIETVETVRQELKLKEELTKQLETASEEEKQVIEEKLSSITSCSFREGHHSDICTHEALKCSPSGYCRVHLLKDPKLPEFGIEVPKYMTKSEKREYKQKVINKLEKLMK